MPRTICSVMALFVITLVIMFPIRMAVFVLFSLGDSDASSLIRTGLAASTTLSIKNCMSLSWVFVLSIHK